MKKRFILLVIFALSIAGLIFSSPPLQGSAALGDDFFEDFESFPTGWNATGLWHRENNTQSGYLSWVPSDPHYMWYGSNSTGNYDTGSANNGTLTSDRIDLTSKGGIIELGFWSYAETENNIGVDKKTVEISDDDGLTWYFLGEVYDSSDWVYYSFDITSYWYSSKVHIRFIFDTVTSSTNWYRGWMIDDVEIKKNPGDFDLQIYQDRYALMNETRMIDFYIWSHFDKGMNFNASILITTPSGFISGYNDTLDILNFQYIPSWGDWHYSLDYIFGEKGLYQVYFIITDEYGREWATDCWWEIGPYFNLWIDQKNYALPGETREMIFYIESLYDIEKYGDIYVNVTTPSGFTDEYYLDYVNVPAHETRKEIFYYTFSEKGSYQVYLIFIDQDGKKWWTDCWWEIGPYFDIRIEQDNEAMIGEEKWMKFHVDSKFDYDTTVNISIMIELQSWKTEIQHEEHIFNIPAWGYWEKELYYTFMEPGHHHAKLEVVNMTGHRWENWCCWNVHDQEKKFELSITQDYSIGLDEEGFMDFRIDSFFDHGMDIDIKITIITPSGTEELLHEETTYIEAFGYWEHTDSYIFHEEGSYEVLFKVVDDIENEWKANCWWKVGESDGDGDEDDGDDDQISPGFEGIFIMGALAISTVLIRKRRK
ncbi:MAG: hypothetical protein ACFE9L_01735 [Candidatus Hodarchaeota archaeon]